MRTLRVVCIVAAAYTLLSSCTLGQVDRAGVEQIRSAAGERLSEFLAMIPHGQEPAYGFASRGEFPEATLGEPYRVFTMATGDSEVGSEGVLRKLDEWRVPVSVRGDVRVLMTVVRTMQGWRAVDCGASLLARDLSECERRYGNAPVFPQRGLLRLYRSSCDLLLLYNQSVDLDRTTVVPLESTRRLLHRTGFADFGGKSLREVLPLLRQLSGASPANGH